MIAMLFGDDARQILVAPLYVDGVYELVITADDPDRRRTLRIPCGDRDTALEGIALFFAAMEEVSDPDARRTLLGRLIAPHGIAPLSPMSPGLPPFARVFNMDTDSQTVVLSGSLPESPHTIFCIVERDCKVRRYIAHYDSASDRDAVFAALSDETSTLSWARDVASADDALPGMGGRHGNA